MEQEELQDNLMQSCTLSMDCTICEKEIDGTADRDLNYERMKEHFIEKHGLKTEIKKGGRCPVCKNNSMIINTEGNYFCYRGCKI